MQVLVPNLHLTWLSLAVVALAGRGLQAGEQTWSSSPARPGGEIVLKTVLVEDQQEDPVAAGKAAAESLQRAMGDVPLKLVLVSECFEGRQYKQQLLQGIEAVLPKDLVVGGSTYGSFTQQGSLGFDAVGLLGIGGDGVGVTAALTEDMQVQGLVYEQQPELVAKRLGAAGAKLAAKLPRTDQDRLLIVISDAHSPTNRYVVEGVQTVVGQQFPITGGSVNKNAGQTFLYFQGEMHQDSALAVMLSGDFRLALAGRHADQNEAILRTARQAATEALEQLDGQPLAMLAFNCGGRRGRLNDVSQELASFQAAIGRQLPLFGCYCAGEIGPVDGTEKRENVLSGGTGWHVMVTAIGR
jgi:hypothetical protein